VLDEEKQEVRSRKKDKSKKQEVGVEKVIDIT